MEFTPGRQNRLSLRASGALALVAAVAVVSATAAFAVAGKPSPKLLPAPGGPPLQTAVLDPNLLAGTDAGTAFARIHGAGATAVRLILYWKFVAPGSDAKTRPSGFDPANPSDPAYHWATFDRQVKLAVKNGLQPVACVVLAPAWAEDESVTGAPGTRRPDARQFAVFAKAAATRYSGKVPGLPRIRLWQAWKEPDYSRFLSPQQPDVYRSLVNAFADAVHAVRT